MIYNYAVIAISNQTVVNITVWDGENEWGPGKGYTTVRLDEGQFCDIGMIYDSSGKTFKYPDNYDPATATE